MKQTNNMEMTEDYKHHLNCAYIDIKTINLKHTPIKGNITRVARKHGVAVSHLMKLLEIYPLPSLPQELKITERE